jgi:hypothetical protein
MILYTLAIFVSSFAFLAYVAAYFISPHMKSEFKRFKLERLGQLTILLQFLGACGLLVGFYLKPILLISAAGLGLLMLFGLLVRIKSKDNVWVSLPAFFFMCLNFSILIAAIYR